MPTSQSQSANLQGRYPKHVSSPRPELYLTDNYIVFDFETTNIDKGSALTGANHLILACFRLGKDHPQFRSFREGGAIWGGEFEQQTLLQLIAESGFIVAHNIKFEYQWLARCGYNLRSAVGYDTYLAEYVLAGNRSWDLTLNGTATRYKLGSKSSTVHALISGGVCPSDIPGELLSAYCQQDVKLTEGVLLQQRRVLQERGLLPVAYCRNLVTPVLADIEKNGMALDAPVVKDLLKEYNGTFSVEAAKFASIAGGRNPRSGKQMGEFIYGAVSAGNLGFAELNDRHGNPDRTAKGKCRTDGPTLSKLVAHTEEQREFKRVCIELSKLKVPCNNLKKMQAVLDKGDTIVRARFNQAITQTHRLSSTGAGEGGFQFHNFDRAFKRCFRTRNDGGWRVVEADAPQLEFRVAGILGKDKAVLGSVRAGEDVHAFTASILGTSRQNAKAHTFKPLYGGQSGTPKEKAYYKAFREKYETLYKEQIKWTMAVVKSPAGELVTPWGLRFYWPGTKIQRSGYVTNTPSIFNYPIQSFATADIIPLCLVMVWHRMANLSGFIVNTIHDSIISEIPDSELDTYKTVVVDSFTKDIHVLIKRLYGMQMDMPLGVAIKSSPQWGLGQEETY